MDAGVWPAWTGVAIAAVAIVVSVRANRTSSTAARAAERSAEAAQDAAEAGRRTADTAERDEQRRTERSDVVWQPSWEGNVWSITNDGQDAAAAVLLVVDAGGERHVRESARVPSGGGIDVDLAAAADSARVADHRKRQSAQAGGWALISSGPFVNVAYRIMWLTEAGTPREDSGVNAWRV